MDYERPNANFCDRLKLWFISLTNSDDLPDPDSSDYIGLSNINFATTDLLIINSNHSLFPHLFCILLVSIVIYSFYISEYYIIRWIRSIAMGISILGYVLYFYNKRMIGLFNFEMAFEQYIKESDIDLIEKQQIMHMKNIDPEEYYKLVANFYDRKYPAIKFYVIMSKDIDTFPDTVLDNIGHAILLFLKELLGMKPKSNFEAEINDIPSLRIIIPTAKVLVFYEWIRNDFYELLFKYL